MKWLSLVCVVALSLVSHRAFAHDDDGAEQLIFVGFSTPFGTAASDQYRDLTWCDPFVMLSANGEGVVVLDVSNPFQIAVVSVYGTGRTFDMIVMMTPNIAALVATADGVIELVDFSSPETPSLRGSIAVGNGGPVSPTRIWTEDATTLYVIGAGSTSVSVFDVSNPAQPVLVDVIRTDEQVALTDIAGVNGLLYCSGDEGVVVDDGIGAVFVVDCAPAVRAVIDTIPVHEHVERCAVSPDGSRLAACQSSLGGRVEIWALESPGTSQRIADMDAASYSLTTYGPADVAFRDNMLMVAWRQAGVQILDSSIISVDGHALRRAFFDTTAASPLDGPVGNIAAVAVPDSPWILLADTQWGLTVTDATALDEISCVGDCARPRDQVLTVRDVLAIVELLGTPVDDCLMAGEFVPGETVTINHLMEVMYALGTCQ